MTKPFGTQNTPTHGGTQKLRTLRTLGVILTLQNRLSISKVHSKFRLNYLRAAHFTAYIPSVQLA